MTSQLAGQASHDGVVGALHRGPDDGCQQAVAERGARPGVRERDAAATGSQRFDGGGAEGLAPTGRADVAFDDAPWRLCLDDLDGDIGLRTGQRGRDRGA